MTCVNGCEGRHHARGLCDACYARARRDGHFGTQRPPTVCAVDICDRDADKRGWCKGHYNRWLRDGKPGSVPIVRRKRRSPDAWTPRGDLRCTVCREPLVEHARDGACRVDLAAKATS